MAANRKNFTTKFLEHLQAKSKRRDYYDTQVRGLGNGAFAELTKQNSGTWRMRSETTWTRQSTNTSSLV